MSKQLTDDDISKFIGNLIEYFERTPLTFTHAGDVSDEGFDHLHEFIFDELEDYSNGYVNYN